MIFVFYVLFLQERRLAIIRKTMERDGKNDPIKHKQNGGRTSAIYLPNVE